MNERDDGCIWVDVGMYVYIYIEDARCIGEAAVLCMYGGSNKG